jgi:hypothetical protein
LGAVPRTVFEAGFLQGEKFMNKPATLVSLVACLALAPLHAAPPAKAGAKAETKRETKMETKAGGGYHVAKEIALGGEGGWDYLTVDPVGRRLYVSHSTKWRTTSAAGSSATARARR